MWREQLKTEFPLPYQGFPSTAMRPAAVVRVEA
jgi:hypothetical protein